MIANLVFRLIRALTILFQKNMVGRNEETCFCIRGGSSLGLRFLGVQKDRYAILLSYGSNILVKRSFYLNKCRMYLRYRFVVVETGR